MGALKSACNKALSIKNTGTECDESMGPSVMLFAVPETLTWTNSDLADFTTFLLGKIHAPKASRVYPLFGPSVPIRRITPNKEADVIFTADDGTQIFIRYGVLNRAFGTTSGGLCFAKALQSLTKAGYSIIEVDNANQVMFRDNGNSTYSAQKTTFMFAPSPDLADLKNPMFSNFQVSVKPEEYVGFGKIFQADDSSITDLIGLIDAEITDATGASTTKLKIGVRTICGETDLVAEVGSPLAAVSNFKVVKKSDGTVNTPASAAIVSGHVELTGTYASGATYIVSGVDASVWFAAGIEGYEGVKSVEITIP